MSLLEPALLSCFPQMRLREAQELHKQSRFLDKNDGRQASGCIKEAFQSIVATVATDISSLKQGVQRV